MVEALDKWLAPRNFHITHRKSMTPSAKPPQVTVVIPLYNVGEFVDSCLKSVLVQSWPCIDCIVVDDGSTDDGPIKVEEVSDRRVSLTRQSNSGVSRARNRGAEMAGGDFLLFLDADDLLHPTAVERLIAPMLTNPDLVASFGAFWKILPSGADYPGQKPIWKQTYPTGDVLEALLRNNFFANGGHILIRRRAFEAVGGFDEGLKLSEDWEEWCRLAAHGEFAFIGGNTEVFYLRVRPGSSSGGLARDWNNHLPFIRKIADNATIRSRFDASQWRAIMQAMLASNLWEAGRVNFVLRQFGEARRLMLESLRKQPSAKRSVLFAMAQLSQLINRPLVSRLRFRDADIREDGS